MNLRTSSINKTGALKHNTAFHSAQLSGVIANSDVKNGMYRIPKCSAILNAMAATRNGFFQIGSRSKLSFSDREFMALNISTVTRIERLIVVARRAISFVNISHPMSGNMVVHSWK